MSAMSFPDIPPEGSISVCELDGKLYYESPNNVNLGMYCDRAAKLPEVFITRELVRPSSLAEEMHEVFVPVHTPLVKRLVQVWYERGFTEALRVAAAPETVDAPHWLQTFAAWTLSFMKVLGSQRLQDGGPRLAGAVVQTRDWERAPVRAVAWHLYMDRLAVAAWDDSVRVFSHFYSRPILKCKGQRLVTCLAWRPLTGTELAVGCEVGVVLWTVDFSNSVGSSRVLSQRGHSPVTSVAWSPPGDLLLTASAADTGVYLWEPDGERFMCLRHVAGGGTCLAAWAPNGQRVFTSTCGLVFRVWETKLWEFERWTVQAGRVQSACWGAGGDLLLFATTEEPCLYALTFCSDRTVFRTEVGLPAMCAQRVLELPLSELPTGERLGGLVSSLAWDPTSQCLAVMFRTGDLVAVYRTSIVRGLQISPSSLVRGYPGETPNAICFSNIYSGPILTIAWSSGRIQYFPIVTENFAPGRAASDYELDPLPLGRTTCVPRRACVTEPTASPPPTPPRLSAFRR